MDICVHICILYICTYSYLYKYVAYMYMHMYTHIWHTFMLMGFHLQMSVHLTTINQCF